MSNPLDNLKAISDKARNINVGKCTISTVGQTYKVIYAYNDTGFKVGDRVVALEERLVPLCVLEDDFYYSNKSTDEQYYLSKGMHCFYMMMDKELEEVL